MFIYIMGSQPLVGWGLFSELQKLASSQGWLKEHILSGKLSVQQFSVMTDTQQCISLHRNHATVALFIHAVTDGLQLCSEHDELKVQLHLSGLPKLSHFPLRHTTCALFVPEPSRRKGHWLCMRDHICPKVSSTFCILYLSVWCVFLLQAWSIQKRKRPCPFCNKHVARLMHHLRQE